MGTDFNKNPKGPMTGGGGKPTDHTRPTPPMQEQYPKPDPDIPVPAGGRQPFKPPVYAQPNLGGQSQPMKPFKNLKG